MSARLARHRLCVRGIVMGVGVSTRAPLGSVCRVALYHTSYVMYVCV